jgi:hypothetical protein
VLGLCVTEKRKQFRSPFWTDVVFGANYNICLGIDATVECYFYNFVALQYLPCTAMFGFDGLIKNALRMVMTIIFFAIKCRGTCHQ